MRHAAADLAHPRAPARRVKGGDGAPIQRLVAPATFAQVLDDVLGRASTVAPPPLSWAATRGIAESGAFVFGRPLTPGMAWARAYPRPAAAMPCTAPVAPAYSVAPAAPPRPAPAVPPVTTAEPVAPPPMAETVVDAGAPSQAAPAPPAAAVLRSSPIVRARRVLTVSEQRALDRLLLLGARLDDRFTADDLRREYRALALRLHPDRHASAPAADRAALAEAFARATASYRCLQAVHAPRA